VLALKSHSRLLQQILLEPCAHHGAVLLEIDLQVLAEAAGIVVDARFGVSERLQQRVHLLDLGVEVDLEGLGTVEKMLHQVLAGLGLAAAALA